MAQLISRLNAFTTAALALLATPCLSSVYYNNDFFTRIPTEETVKYWSNTVDAHGFIKDTFSCEHLFS